MNNVTNEQMMMNFNVAIERLKQAGLPVISFAKGSDEPVIAIGVLPPTDEINLNAVFSKLTAGKLAGEPFSKMSYVAHLKDLPGIIVCWRGQAEINPDTIH